MIINIREDRKAIKDILYKNIKLIKIAKNKENVCQDLTDAILVYLIEKKGGIKNNGSKSM